MRIPHTVTTALSGAAAALLLVAAPAAAATPPRAQVPALIAPEPVGGRFAQQPDDPGCGAGRFAVVCAAPAPGTNAVPGAARNALSAELRAHGSSSTGVPSVRPPSARGPAGQVPPAARRALESEVAVPAASASQTTATDAAAGIPSAARRALASDLTVG